MIATRLSSNQGEISWAALTLKFGENPLGNRGIRTELSILTPQDEVVPTWRLLHWSILIKHLEVKGEHISLCGK